LFVLAVGIFYFVCNESYREWRRGRGEEDGGQEDKMNVWKREEGGG
jgi:hypothetical protein